MDLKGWDDLHKAAVLNEVDNAKALIENGAEVDKGDAQDFTPLHWGAGYNSLEVVKLLLNYPGEGHVALRIKTDGKTVIGELPSVSIKYCPELHLELVAMVGEGAVDVVGGVEAYSPDL